MNTTRLLQLAEFLMGLPPDVFDARKLIVCRGEVSRYMSRLPEGSIAGPLGWLPAATPGHWCWLGQPDGSVLPVFSGSSMWCPRQHDFDEFKSDAWNLGFRLWRQVGEWFETDDFALLDTLFSPASYEVTARGVEEAARRMRVAASQ